VWNSLRLNQRIDDRGRRTEERAATHTVLSAEEK
jgi:hypothetical protein